MAPVTTAESGIATVERLKAGRYTIQAEFPGFEAATVRDVRVGATGNVRRTIVLPIKKVAEDVTVGRDKQSSALDPQGNSFSTVLTREQIEALPDDRDEMEKVLRGMARRGAQIARRRLHRRQAAAEVADSIDSSAAHGPDRGGESRRRNGLLFIDIMTQPGNGRCAGSRLHRDDALNAKNPFTPVKGQESLKQGGFSLSGSIVPNVGTFSLHCSAGRSVRRRTCSRRTPPATVAAPIRRPTDRTNVFARFDQSDHQGHMARFSFTAPRRRWTTSAAGDLPGTRTHGHDRQPVPRDGKRTAGPPILQRIAAAGALGRHSSSQSSSRRRRACSTRSRAARQRRSSSKRERPRLRSGRHRSDRPPARRRPGTARAGEVNYLGTVREFDRVDPAVMPRARAVWRSGDSPQQRPVRCTARGRLPADERVSCCRTDCVRGADDARRSAQLFAARHDDGRRSRAEDDVPCRIRAITDWLGLGTYEQTLRLDGFTSRKSTSIDPDPQPGGAGDAPPTNRVFPGSGRCRRVSWPTSALIR